MNGSARRGQESQLADKNFAFNFEADQQKEQRHKRVIDPVQHVKAGDLCVQQRRVGAGKSRIGNGYANCGGRHEHQTP